MGNRTKNTIRNIFTGIFGNIFTLLLPFVVRTIIIYKLGSEYIGLGSLFTSILQVLSVTELGFASAIACTMYEPIAKKDTLKIIESITLLKTIYKIVGAFILIVGLAITPFLHLLIKDGVSVDVNIYFLYFIHLANTTVSYFFYGYKNTIISANQRYDIINCINATMALFRGIIQIIILLISSNYYLYIITLPIVTIISNLFINYCTNKLYPELNVKTKYSLKGIENIWKKISGIAIGRISLMCRNSFDSIIISSLLGLTTVAIYSNYYLIFSSISSILSVILTSMSASVGNSLVLESEEKNENDHIRFDFYYEVIVSFCTICLFLLYQPFMAFWVGRDLMFSLKTMSLFCIYFYINQLAQVRSVYSEAAGLWWHFRYLTIGEMFANLVLNIGLGYLFGVNGIIIATIITAFVGSYLGCSFITYKKLFHKSAKEYFFNNLFYQIVTIIACILGMKLFYNIQNSNFIAFLINALWISGYAGLFLFITYYCVPKTRNYLKKMPFKIL